MNKTSTYLVTCPHCGVVKRVAFCPTPWSEVESVMWSDGSVDSSEWCEPSWTQQCKSCDKFFQLPPKTTLKVEDTPCEDTGLLSYQSLKHAIKELEGDETAEANARLEAWWSYNRLHRDNDMIALSDEELLFNRSNMQWLLDYFSKQSISPYSLVFELLRLLGNFEEYRKLLDEMTFDRYIELRNVRNEKHGIKSTLEEPQLKRLYSKFIKEKKRALSMPLEIYQISA